MYGVAAPKKEEDKKPETKADLVDLSADVKSMLKKVMFVIKKRWQQVVEPILTKEETI